MMNMTNRLTFALVITEGTTEQAHLADPDTGRLLCGFSKFKYYRWVGIISELSRRNEVCTACKRISKITVRTDI